MSETTLENLGQALGQDTVAAPVSTPSEPQIDAHGRAYATGKRKNAVARVWVKPGAGRITVNGRDEKTYFARPVLRMICVSLWLLLVALINMTSLLRSRAAVCLVRLVLCAMVFRKP